MTGFEVHPFQEVCCLGRMETAFSVVGGGAFVVDRCYCGEAGGGCHGKGFLGMGVDFNQ